MARRRWWNGLSPRAASVAGAADLAAFLEDYSANAVVDTAPYPGIVEALEALQGGPASAGRMHQQAGRAGTPRSGASSAWSSYFSVVTGGDSTPYRKPDPRHLAATLAAMGIEKAVDDRRSSQRYQCRRRAWGCRAFSSPGVMARRKAAMLPIRPSELPGLIAQMG